MDNITKRQLKELAGVDSDRKLAKWWSSEMGERITQQSVSAWPDDEPIPKARQTTVRFYMQIKGGAA